MLTYELKKAPGVPLYEALYRCIREDILTGRLSAGEKLPSKRALAENLKVSKITVEGAYEQLLSEGYIRSAEKIGYFVEDFSLPNLPKNPDKNPLFPETSGKNSSKSDQNAPLFHVDLTANTSGHFPFSVWSRLHRTVLLDLGQQLLEPTPNQGLLALRQAIAGQLLAFRGMHIDPDNVLIGAGTDFLYNLLIQLLGRDKVYAVEEPGYGKIRKIYAAGGVSCISAPMDEKGVRPDGLVGAHVLHISPSHHFPTGIVTPAGRRQALLGWAAGSDDRWIIEDDYDTEFRFSAHPLAAMQSMAPQKVIYMNTFSKTLSPAIRISYMVLPPALMALFRRQLGFYSCTVPSFEQYTLTRFLQEGHFEKHINRMRKLYKTRRNRVLEVFSRCPHAQKLTILEHNAGLHFLLKVDTQLDDTALAECFRLAGIRVQSLGSFYHDSEKYQDTHTLVINYSALREEDIQKLEQCLQLLDLT